MKKLNFLLDMDGVLADFTSAAIAAINKEVDTKVTIKDYAEKCGKWEFYNYWEISEKSFWEIIHCTPNFWENIKPMPWAECLYDRLRRIGNVTIVTNAGFDDRSMKAKLDWLNTHLDIRPSDVIMAYKKELFAGNGILIDDYNPNVTKFIAAGGEAICVASTWNNPLIDFDTVWSYISNYMDSRPLNLINEVITHIETSSHITPNNKVQFASGMQRDNASEKPRFDLIWPDCVPFKEGMEYRLAVHMANGAKHYSARNWEKAEGTEELNRFRESARRHFTQWYYGERDEDHTAATFFNMTGFEMVTSKMKPTNAKVETSLFLQKTDGRNL